MIVVLESKKQTKKYSTLGKLKHCLITRGYNAPSKNLCVTLSETGQEITQRTSLSGKSSNITNIAVSQAHTLLLLENGEVYSCGQDTRIGRIGDGTIGPFILYPTGISQIAVGVVTSYLLHGNGTFYSFGENTFSKYNFIHNLDALGTPISTILYATKLIDNISSMGVMSSSVYLYTTTGVIFVISQTSIYLHLVKMININLETRRMISILKEHQVKEQ
jgi:alpha-tubulin suppressor-like RCC1 family protein